MKKLSFLLAAVVILLTVVSCEKAEVQIPTGYQLCTSEAVNYNLFVPKDWKQSISTGAVGAYCSELDPTNVTVMAWNVASDMTLDAWWEQYKTDFDLVFDEFELISKDNSTLDGAAAQKYTYTAKLGDYEYYYVQCACIRYGMVYVVTFTSTPDNYSGHMQELEDILGYFKFT